MTIDGSTKRYYAHLVKLCMLHNIDPVHIVEETRSKYGCAIWMMKQKLKSAGISAKKPKPKFRFDKDGNVIEIATGKMKVKRS